MAGPRRRAPGLRREEVALQAGVGVTWYTWLEQGRSINASAEVLAAIARTLAYPMTRVRTTTHLPNPTCATWRSRTKLQPTVKPTPTS